MKKILTLFVIFVLGAVLTFLVYQYNQKTAVQLSLQEALERNAEVVINSNLDSSYRVYTEGNSLISPDKFEREFIDSFKKNGTINTNKFEKDFTFHYLVTRDTVQIVILSDEYVEGDMITAVRTTANINDETYTVNFILDIKK